MRGAPQLVLLAAAMWLFATTLGLPEDAAALLATVAKRLVDESHSFVNIKLGVDKPKAKRTGFWIEFDPRLPSVNISNGVRLGMAVTGLANETSVNFFNNVKVGACSSMYAVTHAMAQSDLGRVNEIFRANCHALANRTGVEFRLWDSPSDVEKSLAWAWDATIKCYRSSNYQQAGSFAASTLGPVFAAIPSSHPVHLVDIDTQGADFEILTSIAHELHRVKHLKMECQEDTPLGFLYQSRLPNDCAAAEALLKARGFDVRRVLNNCLMAEMNLYARNANLTYFGSEVFEEGRR